ncbi:hypothetical protein [Mucilaginibacter sp. 22184]|uniref:hypothetical protein n=1 Tax=Mucilaginibacter sp. 22184 TaxID=3453887 RepID=UPI003F863CA6
MKKLSIILLLVFTSQVFGQTISVAQNRHSEVTETLRSRIITSLDSLFAKIETNKLSGNEVSKDKATLSISILKSLKTESNAGPDHQELINLYPVSGKQYFVTTAITSRDNQLKTIFNLIVLVEEKQITFALPVNYLTRTWKTKTVGRIIYHYPDKLNVARAQKFDQNNTLIAQRLGLSPEVMDFYMCANYQEVLQLLGYEYDRASIGKTKDGYGVDGNCIFSIMNNEDFSHDAFHYYAAKVRIGSRNSAAEEGIAYSWGNAYYTDENGEMILQKQLVKQLKQYVRQHPQVNLYDLFSINPVVFNSMAKVRSVIAGLIADEVEQKKGLPGIITLINCGKGDENYLSAIDTLIGINKVNFDSKVKALLK